MNNTTHISRVLPEARVVMVMCMMFLSVLHVSGQNSYEIEREIESSLSSFANRISFMTDSDEPISPQTISSAYGGGTYFIAGGTSTTLLSFLQSYKNSVLGTRLVNHTFDFTKRSISKYASDSSDRRWKVEAKLKRTSGSADGVMYADVPVTIIVRFNGLDKEVTLLEIKGDLALKRIIPQVSKEYALNLTPGLTNVQYYGGSVKLQVDSRSRTVTTYTGGTTQQKEVAEWKGESCTYTADKGVDVKVDGNVLIASIGTNYGRNDRRFQVRVRQNRGVGSDGKSLYREAVANIYQGHKRRTIFSYDPDDSPTNQFDLTYSVKYNFGLNYMYHFEDTRLALGAHIALNNAMFRGVESYSKVRVENWLTGSTHSAVNGYEIKEEITHPFNAEYSAEMDPYGEAKHYTRRAYYMLQGGLYVFQWLRLDVGIGLATAQDLHLMRDAYMMTRYTYTPTSPDLPPIADQVTYRNFLRDYYFKDKSKTSFAVRPALSIQIPIDYFKEKFFTFGAGYTFAPSIKGGNSWEFSIGYGWTL